MTHPAQPTTLHSDQTVPVLSPTPLRPLVGGWIPGPDAQHAISTASLHAATPGGHHARSTQHPPGPQLVLPQGCAESPNESKPLSNPVNGSGRRVACINCRKATKRCDRGRPCGRCQQLGLEGCMDAPIRRRKGPRAVNDHDAPLTRTLIRSDTTLVEARCWQQVTYVDPVSGAAWSTFFASTHVAATSRFTETHFPPLSVPPPTPHAVSTNMPVSSSDPQAGVPYGTASWRLNNIAQRAIADPRFPAVAPAAARQIIEYSTAHIHHVNTQALSYVLPSGYAPQVGAPQPDVFHGHPYGHPYGQPYGPYPNPAPAVDSRVNYQ